MTDADRIAALEAENAALKAELARQHAEILHLRIYAPGKNTEHVVKTTPQIAPTNFAFWGIKEPNQ